MKLLSFGPRGKERPGLLLNGDKVLDLSKTLREAPQTMRAFLEQDLLAKVLSMKKPDPSHCIPLHEVRLAPPVPDPSKILCLGLNYRDHAEEQNRPVPEKPMVFPKVPSAVIATGESITLPDPALETFVDPEAELAVVIGHTASKVSERDASRYVVGYTILNDVSGRDTQKTEKQWLRAKGFDTFAPMGPWIVTKEEIPDPHILDVICRVNDETRQKSNTSNLVFTVPFLVSYLSQTITLLPGDIIATGTPGGVGIFRDPPVRLERGDKVTIEISKIGILENCVA